MSQKVLIVRKKARRNFLQKEIAYREAREILKFLTICRYTVKNKRIFWALVIQLVWYILKTIIHLSVGESGGYLPSREAAR